MSDGLSVEGFVTFYKKDGDKISFKIGGEYYSFWSKDKEFKNGDYVEFDYVLNDKWKNVTESTLIVSDGVAYRASNPDSISIYKASMQTVPKKSSNTTNFMEDIVKFDDVLKMAQDKYGDRLNIDTECLEHDFENKRATFKAVVSIIPEKDGLPVKTISGHGDANMDNVKGVMIKPHYYRMAETRAIARALRFTMNTGLVAEETSDPDNVEKVVN